MGSECRADSTGKQGVHQQRVVSDFGWVNSAELKPWAKRECIKMEPQLGEFRERCSLANKKSGHTSVGSECGGDPTSKDGVHHKLGVTSRWDQSAEQIPRAKRECINKEWCQTFVGSRAQSWKRGSASTKSGARLWWGQGAEPAGKKGVHQQRVVPDFGRVKVQS